MSVSALDIPKAVHSQALLRKHRLGVVVTQSQANPPSPQMESDGDFHLVIFAFITVSLSYKDFGQFLQGTEGCAHFYYHDFKGT